MRVPSLNEICEGVFELPHTQNVWWGCEGLVANISPTLIWGYKQVILSKKITGNQASENVF